MWVNPPWTADKEASIQSKRQCPNTQEKEGPEESFVFSAEHPESFISSMFFQLWALQKSKKNSNIAVSQSPQVHSKKIKKLK